MLRLRHEAVPQWAEHIHMPSVVLREKTVHYELGEHEPPEDGKRLIFLHGDGAALNWWETQLNDFSRHHDTYAVDLPGHGGSIDPLCSAIPGYRDTVAEFTEGMAIEPAVMIGHSLGALVAAAMAAHTADLVEGLVLVSMYTQWRPRAATLKRLSQGVETGAAVALDETLFSDRAPEQAVQWARRQQTRSRAEVLLNDLTVTAEYEATAELERIKQPTLVVIGADDPRISAAEAEVVTGMLPQGQLAVIDAAGHLPMLEQPQAFAEVLGAFLGTF